MAPLGRNKALLSSKTLSNHGFRVVPRDVKLLLPESVGHVVVLAAPAPEHVRETVHQPEVVHRHGRDPAEYVVVGEPVEEGVYGHGEVPV